MKVRTLDLESSDEEYMKSLSDCQVRNVILISPVTNGTTINMELDTGLGISVISKQDITNILKIVSL